MITKLRFRIRSNTHAKYCLKFVVEAATQSNCLNPSIPTLAFTCATYKSDLQEFWPNWVEKKNDAVNKGNPDPESFTGRQNNLNCRLTEGLQQLQLSIRDALTSDKWHLRNSEI